MRVVSRTAACPLESRVIDCTLFQPDELGLLDHSMRHAVPGAPSIRRVTDPSGLA